MLPLSTLVTNIPQSPGKQGSFTPSAISNPSAFKSISSCQKNSSHTLYKAVIRNIPLLKLRPLATVRTGPSPGRTGRSVPRTKPGGSCHLPLPATADTRPCSRALLCPPPSTRGASICRWRGHRDQPAMSRLGQPQRKDACAPAGREAEASTLTAMTLGNPTRGPPSPTPAQSQQSRQEKAWRQLTVSLSNSTTSVSHSMESVSMAESWELWAISCRNRASFSNWDSICSLGTERAMATVPWEGKQLAPVPALKVTTKAQWGSLCSHTSCQLPSKSGAACQSFLDIEVFKKKTQVFPNLSRGLMQFLRKCQQDFLWIWTRLFKNE